MKFVAQTVLSLISIAYPLLWYYSRENGFFIWLAAAMGVLWLIRAWMPQTASQRNIALSLSAFFFAVLIFRRHDSMYWYPVLVNILMLAVFGSSLFSGQTVIEKLARLQQPDLPDAAVRYTRKVTQIWCVFFIANASIAALLMYLEQYRWWALYTGIISYVLMGILFAGEWIYRKLVLKV